MTSNPIEATATWVGALARGGVLMGHEEELGAVLANVVLGPDGLSALRTFFHDATDAVRERERRGAIHACIYLAQADREIVPEEVELLMRIIAHSELSPDAMEHLERAVRVPLSPAEIAEELTQPGLRELMLALSWQLADADATLDDGEREAHRALAEAFGVSDTRLEVIREAVVDVRE